MRQVRIIIFLASYVLMSHFIGIGKTTTNNSLDRLYSFTIPPVDLSCINVESNGDITLTWLPSVQGSGVFLGYDIYCIESGMLPIATINNINTTTYTHVGANGNASAKHYYLVTKSDCSGTTEVSFSDTLKSIFLEINDLGDGRVLVEWNPTHTPQISGENTNYNIMREYPTGVWTVRKQIPFGQYSYRDTIDICFAFINYRIEVSNSIGCISGSNIEGDLLKDIINPYIPIISHVTIDTNNNTTSVFWNKNQSNDTYGYIILKIVNGFWENIDTVYGINTITYSDVNSKHDIMSETYAIAAFDSCIVNSFPYNYQTSAASESHSTIFASSSIDLCNLNMTIDWTSYNGWNSNVILSHYEILVKINNGTYQVIDNIGSDKTRYKYNNLELSKTYCFYVRAVSNTGIISYSNEICRVITPPANPSYHYLSMASHLLSQDIELELYTDPTAAVQIYEIEKKGPKDYNFSIISEITPDGNAFYNYLDNDVKDKGVYEYRVNIVDTCGLNSVASNIVKTIFLKVEKNDMINTLTWTDYLGFDGNVIEYNIYRGENGIYPVLPEVTITNGIRTYIDDLSNEFDSQGEFCYRVEAIESNNTYGFSKTAFSNEVCITFDPVIYVPNSIVINGVNQVFKPVISLYDFGSYQMQIFDRWGKEIFYTNEIKVGWNGTKKSEEFVEEGTYVYLILFKDKEGKRFEHSGTLTVLSH